MKIFLSIIIALSFIISANNPLAAISKRIIFLTNHQNEFKLDNLPDLEERYQNLDIISLSPNDLDDFIFTDTDELIVETVLLEDNKVRNFVNEQLTSKYVIFIGESDTDTLSNYLNHQLTQYQDKITTIENTNFSLIKYTDNNALKDVIKIIKLEHIKTYQDYLLPCLEMIDADPLGYQLIKSGKERNYLLDRINKQITADYFETNYTLYQNISEIDPDQDYYILKTRSYFNRNGHHFTLWHIGPSTEQAMILDQAPHQNNKVTSYSLSLDDINVDYQGPKAGINFEMIDSRTNKWKVSDATFFQNAKFDQLDTFEMVTLFTVKQGTKPKFSYRFIASNRQAASTGYVTTNIYVN